MIPATASTTAPAAAFSTQSEATRNVSWTPLPHLSRCQSPATPANRWGWWRLPRQAALATTLTPAGGPLQQMRQHGAAKSDAGQRYWQYPYIAVPAAMFVVSPGGGGGPYASSRSALRKSPAMYTHPGPTPASGKRAGTTNAAGPASPVEDSNHDSSKRLPWALHNCASAWVSE